MKPADTKLDDLLESIQERNILVTEMRELEQIGTYTHTRLTGIPLEGSEEEHAALFERINTFRPIIAQKRRDIETATKDETAYMAYKEGEMKWIDLVRYAGGMQKAAALRKRHDPDSSEEE
jgi:hypothetical protein